MSSRNRARRISSSRPAISRHQATPPLYVITVSRFVSDSHN